MKTKSIVSKTIRSLIFLFFLLLIISMIRAGVVLYGLHQAAINEPFNLKLTAKWSPAYPTLYSTLIHLQLDRNITIARQPAIERLLLSVPNWLVNIALARTQVLWYPDIPGRLSPIPSPPTPRTVRPQTRKPAHETKTPATASSPQPQPRPETERSVPQREQETTADVATPPIFDPNAKWAAVITPSAPIYDSNGQRLENIPPGSVFEIIQERSSGNGIVYIGTAHTPIGRFNHIVIRAQDLMIYHGKTLTQTTFEERERASRKATIIGAIALRKQQIEAEHNNRNPYQERYHASLRRYQVLRDEARHLRPIYEEKTGSGRINAGNRLREIQQEMTTLAPTVRNLQQQRDSWAEANPLGPPPNPERDPQIIALRRELAELETH